jgi:hypothetical protein
LKSKFLTKKNQIFFRLSTSTDIHRTRNLLERRKLQEPHKELIAT